MNAKNKKTQKKVDLLKMSDSEKMKLIREIGKNLRQKVVEAKLWQSFVEAENLTINRKTIHSEDMDLRGFSYSDLLKST